MAQPFDEAALFGEWSCNAPVVNKAGKSLTRSVTREPRARASISRILRGSAVLRGWITTSKRRCSSGGGLPCVGISCGTAGVCSVR